MATTKEANIRLREYLEKYFCLVKEHRQALEEKDSIDEALRVLESNLKELVAEREEIAEVAELLNIPLNVANPRIMIMDIYDKVKTLI